MGDRVTRILVVGHDASTTQAIRAILESHGIHVIEASNGFSAMRIISDHAPDLIFIDTCLQGIDCTTLTALIKKNALTCDVPVIAFTPDDTGGWDKRFVHAGCDGSMDVPHCEKEIPGILNRYKLLEDK
ncbi:MAG: response regulator [Deltaproteobacteria bacterium]|nr:response regulator [Deltaproteobacteria bacterium]